MRIVFIVDARSAISRNWINGFIERGHRVHVISSYPCFPQTIAGAEIHQFPMTFSSFSQIDQNGSIPQASLRDRLPRGLATLRRGAFSQLSVALRAWLGPLELNRHVQKLNRLIAQISPDITHAMRIPFEGIVAAKSMPARSPLVISVWGNDFTLFAARNRLIARDTRRTLQRADALHCDCIRDKLLALRVWGFDSSKQWIVLPGSGGVRTDLFQGQPDPEYREELNILSGVPVVLNPRGFRAYVRNESFFKALPL